MRIRHSIALAVLAAASFATQALADGWIHATVTIQPKASGAATAPAAPPPVDYYLNDSQRMAAIKTREEGGGQVIQFFAPDQGYMDTFTSKQNEVIHSELTKLAVLPQDNALPTTLQNALKNAGAVLGTARPTELVGRQGNDEIHQLTADTAPGVKITFVADPNTKALKRIVQETPDDVTSIDYDYRPIVLNNIFDFGINKQTTKYVDNMPSNQTRALLDKLDARIDKEFGDGVAVIITDPQIIGKDFKKGGHDPQAPYTVEVFGRAGNAFVYRVHSLKEAPRGNLDQLLAFLINQPASTYVVYDGRTLFQLTYDPETNKPTATERQVNLQAKDFSSSNFQRRIFLGREALGTTVPVSKVEMVEDRVNRPGQKGIVVRRPTSLVYQDAQDKPQQVQANQLTVYWVDESKGFVPVEFYESREPVQAAGGALKSEVLSTKFSAAVPAAADGSSLPTQWETGTWDIRGNPTLTAFNLTASFNRRLDNNWFTKPQAAAQPENAPGAPIPPR